MKRIPVILDGDPGHDDAIAWLIAAASAQLEILAVTTVAGNKDIHNVTRNAQKLCDLFGITAPLAMGAHGPLVAEAITAGEFHGQTGLDGVELPEPEKQLSPESAVALMAGVLERSPEPVTIIATGAETNLGALLLWRPDLKPKIRAFYVMGGGIERGNWVPAAEFNILVDPEAADLVFRSGIPVVMCGLDVTERALIYPEDVEQIRGLGTKLGNIVALWLDFFCATHFALGYSGAPLHDPCAVLALLRPELFTIRQAEIKIMTGGRFTRGATIADYEAGERCNGCVVSDVDRPRFVDALIGAILSYGEEGKA